MERLAAGRDHRDMTAYGTWVAYGGSPSAFGHASVAEQNQVFENAMARGGEDNWAPYDGC